MAEKEPIDWIEDAAKAGKDLREAIQEAHQMMRDLKTLKREMFEMKVAMQRFVEEDIPELIHVVYEVKTRAQLEAYADKMESLALVALKDLSDQMLEAFKVIMRQMEERFSELSAELTS